MIQTDDFSDKASFLYVLYSSSQLEWGQAEDQRPLFKSGLESAPARHRLDLNWDHKEEVCKKLDA